MIAWLMSVVLFILNLVINQSQISVQTIRSYLLIVRINGHLNWRSKLIIVISRKLIRIVEIWILFENIYVFFKRFELISELRLIRLSRPRTKTSVLLEPRLTKFELLSKLLNLKFKKNWYVPILFGDSLSHNSGL